MPKKKYSAKIMVRVHQDVYDGLKAIADAQEMGLADVIRAACEEYITPGPRYAAIPVIGQIVSHSDLGNKLEYFSEVE